MISLRKLCVLCVSAVLVLVHITAEHYCGYKYKQKQIETEIAQVRKGSLPPLLCNLVII